MSSEYTITVTSDWVTMEKHGVNERDDQEQEASSCNPKFGKPPHWISITTIVTLLVVVLGAGLNLVWAQNSRLREMERDHEIRMKLHDLRIKSMDHSRAIAEMSARLEEQKLAVKTKEMPHSRVTAGGKTRMEEQS